MAPGAESKDRPDRPSDRAGGILAAVEDVLLHLCTPADWRAALTTGSVAPPSLAEVGFVHLSTAEQVALPAQRLFEGRHDLVLLAVAPTALDRARIEVRWEPGVPDDPESMRFPHAYGAVPTTAVLGVLPYRPDASGRFRRPDVPHLDAGGRAALLEPSLLRRTATAEVPVTGGTAVRTDAVPASRTHNQLLVHAPVDAGTVLAGAEHVLSGLPHRAATLSGDAAGPVAADLGRRGWAVRELVTMVAPTGRHPSGEVEEVGLEALRAYRDAAWRRRVPGIDADAVTQLTDRYRAEDAAVDLRCLAVRDGAAVVAGCLLKVDGATSWLDGLDTDPAHRRRGHARALVTAALDGAGRAGCDLLALCTPAADRPRRWYARLGFTEVDRRWRATIASCLR